MISSNNVILFPKDPKNLINIKQSVDSINNVRYNHINETLELIMPQLFNNMEIAGFPVYDDEENSTAELQENSIKACSMIVESVRAILMRNYDLYHPFQILSQQIFTKNIEGYGLIPKLSIDFEKLEQENNSEDS